VEAPRIGESLPMTATGKIQRYKLGS
jgi:acyl-coenzyme A synthetase/AMP-(fatty) acid ligase